MVLVVEGGLGSLACIGAVCSSYRDSALRWYGEFLACLEALLTAIGSRSKKYMALSIDGVL